MKKALAILAWFLILSGASMAQQARISGTVQDVLTDEPLAGANVLLLPEQLGTVTDEQGRFLLDNVSPGKHVLEISYLGYQSIRVQIQLQPGQHWKHWFRLTPTVLPGSEVVVEATRAREGETPVVFTNLSRQYIEENHTVEDIPMLLTEIPNVYAYADAGNPMGYTYLKVRGFDQKRIGVMVNGIPLNDPEDHQVYWVDLPDFAESLQSIQLQRGVGSSLYGISTFGGSLNLLSQPPAATRRIEVFSNYGSYNTRRFGLEANTGLLGKGWAAYLRLSRLLSDGYRERSGTEQWAYFVALSRAGKKSFTQLNVYGGKEITHAAWEASPEHILKENPRHNPITYPNAIDNFSQPHFQLHHSIQFGSGWRWKNSLFYIRGKGYYESLKKDRDLWEYGLAGQPDVARSDLIRQKWVLKNQYGWISEAAWQHGNGELTFGTYLSLFNSDHWGEVDRLLREPVVQSAEPEMNFRYYRYFGDKTYLTAFANELYRLHPVLRLMVNLHYQHIEYQFEHGREGNFVGPYRHAYRVEYDFFNPRMGLHWQVSPTVSLMGNVSIAQREPADDELFDIWSGPDDLGVAPLFARADTVYRNGEVEKIQWSNPLVKPERLIDFELGSSLRWQKARLQVNLFWMNFQNEIVPFGQFDEEGNPIRGNAERTVHRGVEISLQSTLPAHLEFRGNLALNEQYFESFVMKNYDGSEQDLSGNAIAGFPNLLANARLTYRREPVGISLHWQRVGKQYLDNSQNEARIIPPFSLLNASARIKLVTPWQLRGLEVTLRLNNILNRRYFTAGYYDPWSNENFYWPGAEFHLIAGLRLIF